MEAGYFFYQGLGVTHLNKLGPQAIDLAETGLQLRRTVGVKGSGTLGNPEQLQFSPTPLITVNKLPETLPEGLQRPPGSAAGPTHNLLRKLGSKYRLNCGLRRREGDEMMSRIYIIYVIAASVWGGRA